MNKMKLLLKFGLVKRPMGVKVHQDGFKLSRVAECGSLHEIEANVNLLGLIKRKT